MNAPPSPAFAFQARLARFDRPAISLAELLQAEGGDFVHLAIWTLLGRRATPEEYQRWYILLAAEGNKPALLFDMSRTYNLSDARHHVPGLLGLLKLERASRIAVLGRFIPVARRLPWLAWPVDVAKRTSAKGRWAYRHGSKWLARSMRRIRMPSQNNMGRRLSVGDQQLPAGTDARTADIYRQLCWRIDKRTKET